MENGDKLGEDSVLCPIRQWSIFKAGPYWTPFPYNRTIMENAQIQQIEVTPADAACTRWERWVRRFENFVLAKGINDDAYIKAMMLHHTGETVVELSESVGVLDTDTYAVAREKLTAYSTPRHNTEYEIFVFRHTQQLPCGDETLNLFQACLQHLSKNCNFANKNGEIRSQIIHKCAMTKIKEMGLSEADITLEQSIETFYS